MEKYITDPRTGLDYELVGDYYLIAGDDDPAPPAPGPLGPTPPDLPEEPPSVPL